jgi:cysteine synthase B
MNRTLKRDLPEVRCYSAQPSSGFHGLEGLKHMPTAIVPGSYDERLADGNLWIETEDAYRMVRRANSPRAANPLLLRQCSPTAPKNT